MELIKMRLVQYL